VLETARILSQYQLQYTITYALWDEEEIGLIGSRHYAEQAAQTGEQIVGVINLDMIGWDGNNDGLMDIHTRNVGQSVALANFGDSLNTIYNLGLAPVIYNPGTTASDHSSFWNRGFSAILYSEAYYGNDFNPYYHSSSDRISRFNLTFFHNMSRLVSATMAALVGQYIPTVVDYETPVTSSFILQQNYPNPFNNSTQIEYSVQEPGEINLAIFNSLGEKIMTLKSGYHTTGNYKEVLQTNDFPSGIYYYVLSGNDIKLSRKMILIR
ncbi:MAG: M28 family peptidase, partial [Calditrichaeota bacterium]